MSLRFPAFLLVVLLFPLPGFAQIPLFSLPRATPHQPAAEPAVPCPPVVMTKTIPHTQVLLVPHEHATTLPDWQLRPVERGRLVEGPVLDFREEKQVVCELRLQPRQVEEQVICNESKPVTVTDPCTGHCHTEYRTCPVVKTVKVTVYDTVPVQREVLVRVPVLKAGGEIVVKQLTLVPAEVPAVARGFHAVTTHNELKVVVPVPECFIVPPACTLEPHGGNR